MALLSVQDIRKSYRGAPVLDGVSLALERGRRYGLVGPNGGGKTTLARILAGLLEPDGGTRHAARGLRIVYLPQRPELTPGRTPREEVRAAFADLEEMEARLAVLEERMGEESLPAGERRVLLERHGNLLSEFEARGGWDRERRIEASLEGLGVPPGARDRDVSDLSGGQQTRVALARALLREPDLLILDEPTNHLDLDGVEWLENHLLGGSSTVLAVSHDRWFLDRVVTSILELEAGRLHAYPGGYAKFERLREERRERERRAHERQADRIRKEEEFIRRNIAAQRTAVARGRRKRLARLERREAPPPETPRMAIPPGDVPAGGSAGLLLEDVTVRFGDREVLSGLSLRVLPGQRVGVVGPNGAGKTTLLRLLAGEILPSRGRILRGRKVRVGYLPQEPERGEPGRTVLETFRARAPRLDRGEARSWLARFLFRGDEVEKDAGVLSGGEAARLALALLFLSKPNLLLLDEPTNHLDIPAREALEAALLGFPGTAIVVSHDRYLLETVAVRIVEIRPGAVIDTPGGWTEHRERRREPPAEGPGRAGHPASRPSREARATAREGGSRPGRIRNPFRFAKLEEEIIAREERLEEIHRELADPGLYRNPGRLKELRSELPAVQAHLARLYAEWERWVED